MVRPNDVAAMVLAAGRSSRMGKFKPLLPIKGNTLIEQVIKNIRAASIERILVVVGHQAETLIPILERNEVCWAANPDYIQEMFSSIKVGVDHLDGRLRAFFLVPGDMPFVRPQTFQKLLAAFDSEKMDMLRPRYGDKRGHPVLISASRIPSIAGYGGSGGLRAVVNKQNWRTVDLDCNDPGILVDLDNLVDYENALAESNY